MPKDVDERLANALDEVGADAQRAGAREWSVAVPSAKRGSVACGLELHEKTLVARAFVLRAPERRHEDVFRRVLEKNFTTRHWSFALDSYGDVFLVAELPLPLLDAASLDELLGSLSVYIDETFEGLARTGFDVPDDTRFGAPPSA